MSSEGWFALGLLAFAIILFVTEWLRVDVVALAVVVILMLSGLLSSSEALSGFSHPVVLTIAALFIIGGGVMQTGLAAALGERILRIAGNSQRRLTVVIMLAVAALSGFMSDTGTVAILLPAVISLSWSARLSPSKLLIPLSYGALLGGAATLIGTPPNILVSDLLRENGQAPFGFFDYTPIGLILIAAGVLYMLLVGQRLLPDQPARQEIQRVPTSKELAAIYELPNHLFRLRVRRNSEMVGVKVAETRFRQEFNLNILEIQRPPEPRPVIKVGESKLVWQNNQPVRISPIPDMHLDVDDILTVQGSADDVAHASAAWNLAVQPAEGQAESDFDSAEVGLAEILLPPRSELIGKTVVEARFGSLHHLTVLGIHRPSSSETLDIKTTPLRFGDNLLVQGSWKDILALRNLRRDFVVTGQPEAMLSMPARRKAPLALLILLGLLVVLILDLLPLAAASLLAALLMILSGCLTIDDAYAAIDWKSIVLVAGMLPMSVALEKTGVVNLASESLISSLGSYGPVWVLAGVFLLTSLFTQVLSNTATTVLIAPIALVSAQKLGVQPQAFLMGVAIAASLAMGTPVASPVNTLVMAAGNYRFSDYLKTGLPLIAMLMVISLLVLPILWPF